MDECWAANFLSPAHDKICTEIESKHLRAISYLLNIILKLGLLFCMSLLINFSSNPFLLNCIHVSVCGRLQIWKEKEKRFIHHHRLESTDLQLWEWIQSLEERNLEKNSNFKNWVWFRILSMLPSSAYSIIKIPKITLLFIPPTLSVIFTEHFLPRSFYMHYLDLKKNLNKAIITIPVS